MMIIKENYIILILIKRMIVSLILKIFIMNYYILNLYKIFIFFIININKFKNINKLNYFYNYSFSYKFNITKIEYFFDFYDNKNKLILPPDMTLYNDLHIVCYVNKNNKFYIHSLAEISENKYFRCIEFINLNEIVKFGINIFNKKISYIIYFKIKNINYNNFNYLIDDNFDPL